MPFAWRSLGGCLLAGVLLGLTGCSTTKFTVDDGRALDPELLARFKLYGQSERLTRPAIARSASLNDAQCDKQWELPVAVASSQAWSPDERVAWVRTLGVDERLTVVAAAPGAPLQAGDRIVELQGKAEPDAERMTELLGELRDAGKPFAVKLASGRQVQLVPFEVCRGYVRFAPPNAERTQDYHWLLSIHPLELAQAELTEDEALWTVLWTQGLSEEGGARMKTYHYGTKLVGTLYNIFTIATGIKGAALAAEAALKAAKTAAVNAATEAMRNELLSQAQAYATQRAREVLVQTAQKMTQQQAVNAMQQAALNRGTLMGVARVAATVFDRADAWAFERAEKLHANPLAGFTLHRKLAERGLTRNALVLDGERMQALTGVAQARGLEDAVVAALDGLKPQELVARIDAMPLASARKGFAYEDAADDVVSGTYAQGLIAASLSLPLESRTR